MDIIYEKVGKRLNEARIESKKTLSEAGTKVGVHKSTVLRWENGETENIKLAMIEALADFYGVNSSWLAGNDVSKNNNISNVKFASYNGIDTQRARRK